MARVKFVEADIRRIEGFDVRFLHAGPGRQRGRDVRSDREDLPPYGYARRRSDRSTVAEWVSGRFEVRYPGFTAEVLDGNGSVVHGRTLLATVRASY